MVAATVLIAALGFGRADCTPSTASPEVDLFLPTGARFYADIDCGPGCDANPTSIWIYEEANGRDGLQRKDDLAGDQTCGLYPPDRLVI